VRGSQFVTLWLLLLSMIVMPGSSGAQPIAMPLITAGSGDCLPQSLEVRSSTGFKLNALGLKSLRLAGLPPSVLDPLVPLQDRFFVGQDAFAQELMTVLDTTIYTTYEEILFEVSTVGPLMVIDIRDLKAQTTPEHPRQRQSCRLNLAWKPISIADGIQVRAGGLILQGHAQVPTHGRVTLTSVSRWVGTSSLPSVEIFESGFAGPFTIETMSEEMSPPTCDEVASREVVINIIAKRLQEQAEETLVALENVIIPLIEWNRCVASP
jgi:hypothetical protein